MRKLILLLILFMNLSAFSMSNIEDNGIYYKLDTSNQTASVIGVGNIVRANIPSQIISEGITYTVTSIGPAAFACESVKYVTVPSTVVSIGESAFDESALTTITLSEGLKSIGDAAFWLCQDLTSITIPGRYSCA